MADYTTLAEVKAEIPDGPFSTTDYDAQITSLITVASRLIDKYLGVWPSYFASTSEETRYFDGTGSQEVKVDDLISITSLAVAETGDTDYTTWTTSDMDYYVRPYNYAGLGLPISHIVVDHNGDQYSIPPFPKALQITGVFGFSSTPPELVAQATRVQVIQWLMRSKQGWQNTGANESFLTDTAGKLSDDVKTMLLPYVIGRME